MTAMMVVIYRAEAVNRHDYHTAGGLVFPDGWTLEELNEALGANEPVPKWGNAVGVTEEEFATREELKPRLHVFKDAGCC